MRHGGPIRTPLVISGGRELRLGPLPLGPLHVRTFSWVRTSEQILRLAPVLQR